MQESKWSPLCVHAGRLLLLVKLEGSLTMDLIIGSKGFLTCAGWWFKPDFIINELNVNSAITSPAHDEAVPYAEKTMVKGYAYAGTFLHSSRCFQIYINMQEAPGDTSLI